MPDTPEHLARRLHDEGEKVRIFFQTLTADQWGRTVYTEGTSWTARQVLAHLVSSESSLIELLLNVLSGGGGAPDDFDLDAFNAKEVASLTGIPVEELVHRFTRLRLKTVSLVADLGGTDLDRTGRHPYLGVAPLVDIIKLIYRHNQIHLRDIKRVIEG